MRDLQRRLGAAGFDPVGAEPGVFCVVTSDMVTSFQTQRGVLVSGACDEPTWLALIEAGWSLGDRLLMLNAPMLRGDDVADLQRSLNHVGFDCGRPDGIFGPSASRAVIDFQRNSGLTADGICGAQTVRTLRLVSEKSGTGPGVASIREAETRSGPSSIGGLRLVVGQFGGLSSITRTVARSLRERGATVMSTDEYEAAAQAAAANRFGANAYVGFDAHPAPRSIISYFAVPSFESIGGRVLASHIVDELDDVLEARPELAGMRLPVLRETRMPAVLCSVGPVRSVVDRTNRLSEAVTRAVAAWSQAPMNATGAVSRPHID
ncbi:MAG: peptidoglycan-binding protein [Ilumatobacter sp.]|uniref:peptidoglycan-binding protein n=1 Tax=Ilumatobacter sp. TaxID=1967498 RepID=UPI0032985144